MKTETKATLNRTKAYIKRDILEIQHLISNIKGYLKTLEETIETE